MTPLPTAAVAVLSAFLVLASLSPPSVHALGSGATLAVASDSLTVCGISAARPIRNIQCFRSGQSVALAVPPNVSFSAISGDRSYFCGLREGGGSFFCWDTNLNSTVLSPKRLYINASVPLATISVGDDHICAIVNATRKIECWRAGRSFELPLDDEQFTSISSGSGFSCGILANSSRVRCWGSNLPVVALIQNGFGVIPMASLTLGSSHACGLNAAGFVICKGSNESGQLNVPFNSSFEYSMLSLGENHSCGIRSRNKTVVCWGGVVQYPVNGSFETIVSGSSFTCGLVTGNLSVMCWGRGWPPGGLQLPLEGLILPGPCVQGEDCSPCGNYLLDQMLCSGNGNICRTCNVSITPPGQPPPLPPPLPPSPAPSPPSKALRRGLMAFAIIGSVGMFVGVCSVIYCLWVRGCFGHKKIHNSVQPTITRATSNNNGGSHSNASPPSRSSTLRRQASRAITMRRQRSGTSSKHPDKAEEFSFVELASATDGFSLENKIGAGSFGVVYRGKLPDGREVAIKRGETGEKMKKFQEKESAFDSELAFLSRLHHKHLVRLVGYCEENDERLLVYEYMKNGALFDHLHGKNNVEKSSSFLNSWRMRIKIALDASRGIEYLHNYAVPPIIHRDIKSSNILLDANWTARVSDFGLSMMGDGSSHDIRPFKAAGTVGYIDPEYYSLNVLTAKSDVYGFGMVLLELLTGKRAIFKNGEDGGTPTSLVDYAVPAIATGEVIRVLDPRVGPPELNEVDAVELVAYTAMHSVNAESKDRPTIADIVANLERALAQCDETHGSISSCGTISIVSE
ncbi:putative serine/threonine-protein kinase-like protein CCR3 [Punica granatum]|uniref:non-specific serine/threonine protein kinase n=2 Tax=Punica granatum TaxID=22663 RepID=A0A218WAP7_PUNGR|nr:putative serine/threonine-protein kinase-like protein CCR3 [Punica granatum]OWM69954.1 hypothetical protein CDL15_Pgr025803 [Punica granatum]PKI39558.1 hypothetical protein CRG98_040028 [Punica granatum]